MTPDEFIRANAELMSPPLVPEISLYLATEVVPLWRKTEEELNEMGVPPPYWAFAWAGGQALARYILDNPDAVRGKRRAGFRRRQRAGGAGGGEGRRGHACWLRTSTNSPSPPSQPMLQANGVTVATTADDMIGSALKFRRHPGGRHVLRAAAGRAADGLAENRRCGHSAGRSRPQLFSQTGAGAACPL